MAKIETGESVVIILREPREKIWGILGEIDPAGVFLRGIDLNAFDDWLRAVAENEPFSGMTDYFLPMWRVEKLSRDESSFGMPSLAEQVKQKTGFEPTDF